VTKKVGDLVLTVVAAGEKQGLTVLRTRDGRVDVVGRLATSWRPEQILVQGTRVLLLGPAPFGAEDPASGAPSVAPRDRRMPIMPRPFEQPRTRIAELDLTDPAAPRLVRTLDLDGRLVGARLAGGVVRLAVASTPSRLPFVRPDLKASDGRVDDAALEKAVRANQRVVRTAGVEAWLPRYTLTPADGRPSTGQLLGCEHVGVPADFSGLGTLAMLNLDLRSGGVDRWQGAGVVADGATLYSSGDRTYVTTQPWGQWRRQPWPGRGPLSLRPGPAQPQDRTVVHAFATAADGVRYLGSGSVDGTLLGQYALDEHDGRLRVATTRRPTRVERPPVVRPSREVAPDGSGDTPTGSDAAVATVTSSTVTVLQLRGDRLEQVGRVDGLGPDETIHGVRFAGPLAYVVTFRQTDPLFVVDLADPTRPRVAGQLKVLGYSAYLHPLGDGLLLGVGQDATEQGERTGLLLSLFDVSDAAAPRLLDKVSLPGAWPQTEWNAHAFTYADGLTLVPVEATDAAIGGTDGGTGGGTDGGTAGGDARAMKPVGAALLAVRVEGRQLGDPTLLQLASDRGTNVEASGLRAFVDGGRVWSVAPGAPSATAAVHDVATLRLLSTLPF
jgi:hypothetical protein